MFLYGATSSSNSHHNQLAQPVMRRSTQYPYPPPQSHESSNAEDNDEDEYEEEEEDEDYDESASYQQQQSVYQRPHGRLAPSGLSIPPSMPFAPLAKLSYQQGGGRGSGAPYVYSPHTVPTPPPPVQGYMHPQLRAPSQPPPGHPHYQQQPQQQGGQFSVLRTDRRTGNLQVAGMSQTTHSGAVHAMRQAPPSHPGGQQGMFATGGQDESYNPRAADAQAGSYICSVQGCGKRYTFASNLRRHVRTAHPEIA